MQTIDQQKRGFTIREVVFLAIIAIFFGIIYQLWSYVYYLLAATPLEPLANDITLGVWVMAGPLAGILLKRRGVSIISEFLAAAVEMLLFSSWGVGDLINGAVQGLGSELGFATCRYRNWDKAGLFWGALWTTIITFAWDLLRSGYAEYGVGMCIALFIIRFASIGLFSGVLVYKIAELVNKTGLLDK